MTYGIMRMLLQFIFFNLDSEQDYGTASKFFCHFPGVPCLLWQTKALAVWFVRLVLSLSRPRSIFLFCNSFWKQVPLFVFLLLVGTCRAAIGFFFFFFARLGIRFDRLCGSPTAMAVKGQGVRVLGVQPRECHFILTKRNFWELSLFNAISLSVWNNEMWRTRLLASTISTNNNQSNAIVAS